eukprot:CAMPEP_0178956388 /NCGR_PEP_ID=MMETSP0789-20121207/10218_1 /TAXON_ID=3005 /ORGANISM="Rhizosolenia setigera, Strain CCMP 1694" /LENGTH=305 /DNA_ID=CAMNT_0020638295 /DNA_START=518 /DNA_END=1433 /DNA_ORIENTATION=+
MESSRSKRRRLILVSSNVSSQWPGLPAICESLNDDTLTTILEFVGDKSYRSFGGVNKHCKEVYLNTQGMTKETFLFGYAPLSVIIDRYDDDTSVEARGALSKGVVFYNRRDVLDWALQHQMTKLLSRICSIAAGEGRIDILVEMWNYIDDDKRSIFRGLGRYAAIGGKLNVLKWIETKGLFFDKDRCAMVAACHAQPHIIQWLKEEQDFELDGELYLHAIRGGQLNVMKWLREQEVYWDEYTFTIAAEKGNLEVLQWLHDEGCPWPKETEDEDELSLHEDEIEPEKYNGFMQMDMEIESYRYVDF